MSTLNLSKKNDLITEYYALYPFLIKIVSNITFLLYDENNQLFNGIENTDLVQINYANQKIKSLFKNSGSISKRSFEIISSSKSRKSKSLGGRRRTARQRGGNNNLMFLKRFVISNDFVTSRISLLLFLLNESLDERKINNLISLIFVIFGKEYKKKDIENVFAYIFKNDGKMRGGSNIKTLGSIIVLILGLLIFVYDVTNMITRTRNTINNIKGLKSVERSSQLLSFVGKRSDITSCIEIENSKIIDNPFMKLSEKILSKSDSEALGNIFASKNCLNPTSFSELERALMAEKMSAISVKEIEDQLNIEAKPSDTIIDNESHEVNGDIEVTTEEVIQELTSHNPIKKSISALSLSKMDKSNKMPKELQDNFDDFVKEYNSKMIKSSDLMTSKETIENKIRTFNEFLDEYASIDKIASKIFGKSTRLYSEWKQRLGVTLQNALTMVENVVEIGMIGLECLIQFYSYTTNKQTFIAPADRMLFEFQTAINEAKMNMEMMQIQVKAEMEQFKSDYQYFLGEYSGFKEYLDTKYKTYKWLMGGVGMATIAKLATPLIKNVPSIVKSAPVMLLENKPTTVRSRMHDIDG